LEFKAFATGSGLAAMPAGEDTVSRFLAWLDLAGQGSGVQVAVVAIAFYHAQKGLSNPCGGAKVKLVVDGVERAWSAKAVKHRRDPFPVEALQAWVRSRAFGSGIPSA
jgi:hypothetical protein